MVIPVHLFKKTNKNKKNPLTQAQRIGNAASQIRLVADQV